MNKKILIISLLIFIVDFIIKKLVVNFINYNDTIFLIHNFFYLTNVKNTGGAFSILSDNIYVLILISIIFLIWIFNYLNKKDLHNNLEIVSYGMLIGGLFGNLFDRLIYNGVVDYIGLIFGSYNYPIFNFADISIVLSVIVIIYIEFRSDTNGDSSRRR